MGQYQFTSQAQQDLIEIRRVTVERWGSKQAIIYLEELKKAMELLSSMPLMGKNCADDLGKDIYRFLYSSHAIYYFALPNRIIVIAILHQSMVPEQHLASRL